MSGNNAYGLIGHPLTHSFSRPYFEDKFRQLNLQGFTYHHFDISDLVSLKSIILERRLSGFNVTIPYKESVLPLLSDLQGAARDIRAVNCVKVNWINDAAFTLSGYNTDHYGFAQSIKPFLEPIHQKALVLGTGGASRAVAYALKQIGVEVYFVTSREKRSGNYFTYEELNEHILNACRLIINTTPLGMFPDIKLAPGIPYEFIGPDHLLYDLIYNPEETLFLEKGRQQGAVTMNGLNMLRLQADKSWEIWNAASAE